MSQSSSDRVFDVTCVWCDTRSDVVDMIIAEFEDADSASSSDMDEYESEDELGDMFFSPRNQKHKKPQPAKTSSAAGKSKPKSRSTPSTASSKPQTAKPPVASKPTMKSSSTKPSAAAATAAGVKPGPTAKSDDVGSFLGMKEYMEAMDRELAKTTVGKSFVRDGDTVGFSCTLF